MKDISIERLVKYYSTAYHRSETQSSVVFPVATWHKSEEEFGKPSLLSEPLKKKRGDGLGMTKAKQLIALSELFTKFMDYNRFHFIYWNCNSFVQFFAKMIFPRETGLY